MVVVVGCGGVVGVIVSCDDVGSCVVGWVCVGCVLLLVVVVL